MSNSSGEYEDHVARQNTAYLIAFEEFEAGLSVEERALLRGTATPDIEDHQADSSKRLVFGIDRDVADSSKASYVPDLASEIDSVVDRKSLSALRDVGPEFEAGSGRFHVRTLPDGALRVKLPPFCGLGRAPNHKMEGPAGWLAGNASLQGAPCRCRGSQFSANTGSLS